MPISIRLAPNKTMVSTNCQLAKKKSFYTSRSFNGMISDYDSLRTQVSNYAAIKHDFKSKNPTTRWSDVIKLK